MKREELWTPSARRFECLLKAAQNGDYNAYMSLMARFFKVMDDKARNNYLRDYEMFTALVERSEIFKFMRLLLNTYGMWL